MPAESIRAAHSVLTEISAHPVSKGSLTEGLHHPTPAQKRPVRAARGIFGRDEEQAPGSLADIPLKTPRTS